MGEEVQRGGSYSVFRQKFTGICHEILSCNRVQLKSTLGGGNKGGGGREKE